MQHTKAITTAPVLGLACSVNYDRAQHNRIPTIAQHTTQDDSPHHNWSLPPPHPASQAPPTSQHSSWPRLLRCWARCQQSHRRRTCCRWRASRESYCRWCRRGSWPGPEGGGAHCGATPPLRGCWTRASLPPSAASQHCRCESQLARRSGGRPCGGCAGGKQGSAATSQNINRVHSNSHPPCAKVCREGCLPNKL